MATIRDVARLAGVSMTTVSHVVNGTRTVSAQGRLRVEQAIQTLGYVPSAVARSLQRPPYGVITKIEFNQAVKWDVPVFGDPQLIDDVEFIEMIRARRQEARDMLMVEPDVTAIQAANDARPKAKGLMAPKKAAVRR